MRYRTTKCPFCGFKLEDRATYAKELIGPPVAKCPSCHHPIKTGMKYWPAMSGGEKAWFVLRSLLLFPYTIAMYTIMFCIVPYILIAIFADADEFIDKHSELAGWYAGIVAVGLTVVFIRGMASRVTLRPENEDIPEWQ